MRNKLKIEETNKNRNATYVRNDSEKKEKSPTYSVPEGKWKKMKKSRNNKNTF